MYWKPTDLCRFIKQLLTGPVDLDVEALKQENEFLKEKVAELEARITELQANVPVRFLL